MDVWRHISERWSPRFPRAAGKHLRLLMNAASVAQRAGFFLLPDSAGCQARPRSPGGFPAGTERGGRYQDPAWVWLLTSCRRVAEFSSQRSASVSKVNTKGTYVPSGATLWMRNHGGWEGAWPLVKGEESEP